MPVFQLLVQSMPVLLAGALLTLKFAVLSMAFGLTAATLVALMGISNSTTLRRIAQVYVSIMRGTPLLVQIFVIYYGLPAQPRYFAGPYPRRGLGPLRQCRGLPLRKHARRNPRDCPRSMAGGL